jgi:branched-chain amino acid aminotransferase
MMNFADRDGVIWMDGALVPWRDAQVHVLTHTLHYGLGCFEGVRAYDTDRGTMIFRLQDHTRRLLRSCHILGMKVPFDAAQLDEAQCETVRRNGLKSAYIRPLVFMGAEGMGLRADNLSVRVAIAAWEWGAYLGSEALEKGIRIRTSSFTRHHPNSAMTKAKANGQYINSIMALQEALACGYDEALLLDTMGYVAEGSGENFFMVIDGVIYTPDLNSALPGITRDAIMILAREDGIPVVERRITRDEVYVCDEAFFTGTAAEVTPIRELDERRIGNGLRGPITEHLQRRFFDTVEGRSDAHNDWLTRV